MEYAFGGGDLTGPPVMSVGDYVDSYQADIYGDTFSNAEFVPVKSVLVDRAAHGGVFAVAFDGQEEMLWMGNGGGHVTSYYSLMMQKYTSFQVHATDEIRHLLTVDHHILSLTADTLHCSSKHGLPIYRHRSPSLANMQCMMFTQPNAVLMGGHQPTLVELNIETRQETRQVEVSDAGCAIMRCTNSYVCCGDISGKVSLLDPISLKCVHQLQAHTGTLSDFDVYGNQLITCGFSDRNGAMTVDRFLMVFDMRYIKQMAPFQLGVDPMFLRFIPTFSNRICVVSQTGVFQVLEQGMFMQSPLYQIPMVDGTFVSAFDLSSSNQVLAFGDSCGYLHTFAANTEQPVMHEFPAVTEFAPRINYEDEYTPYSIIPTPYPPPGEKLLSDWPAGLCQFVYRKPARLEPEILQNLKPRDNTLVLYGPRPPSHRANQVPYELEKGDPRNRSRAPVSPMERSAGDKSDTSVPKHYRKVEIKYSKLGVEDFDFHYYNKTNFAGLETHIPNAYCNAMLQVLYFIEPLRCTLQSHLCEREFCLACELGFLFHMLDQQKGKTCQASNFLRAFRTIREASALGLVLSDSDEALGRANLPRLIQNWNRFILQQLDSELTDQVSTKLLENWKVVASMGVGPPPNLALPGATPQLPPPQVVDSSIIASSTLPQSSVNSGPTSSVPPPLNLQNVQGSTSDGSSTPAEKTQPGKVKESTVVKSLFSYSILTSFTCLKCSTKMSRNTSNTVTDLTYPSIPAEKTIEKTPFTTIVERSMCKDVKTHTWCTTCNAYQLHIQSKEVQTLPDVLSLNCHLENDKSVAFWKAQEEIVQIDRDGGKPAAPAATTFGGQSMGAKSSRPCRYGPLCTRSDCRYQHDSQLQGGYSAPPARLGDTVLNGDEVGPHWVPMGLLLRLTSDGKVEAVGLDDDKPIKTTKEGEETVVTAQYELLASVVHIRDSSTDGHLAAHVLAGERYHKRKEGITHKTWYLLNDFAITPVEKYASVNFDLSWKLPCVLYFNRIDINTRHDLTITNPITAQSLFVNASLVTPRRKIITFVPLDTSELPQKGDIVGLDAEFVTLNAEEAELRSDGTRSTIKPSHMCVARVTCIREKGPLKFVPFIDDYISTQEQVVDYLTQFSGIKPGDLDATQSSKHLTTLKSTYLKLRYLISCGVVFVGHGLKKDFRVLNLVVPHDQVVDTVDLFRLPRQRMISLKFLAWHFLGDKIQSDIHDSIEDAVTALKLYYKYQELCKLGAEHLKKEMNNLYETGRRLEWRIVEDSKRPTDAK